MGSSETQEAIASALMPRQHGSGQGLSTSGISPGLCIFFPRVQLTNHLCMSSFVLGTGAALDRFLRKLIVNHCLSLPLCWVPQPIIVNRQEGRTWPTFPSEVWTLRPDLALAWVLSEPAYLAISVCE